MDDPLSVANRFRFAGTRTTLMTSLLLMLTSSCRVPDPPVLKDKSLGITYDTALEDDIRSGKAHQLVTTALAQYVDTLAEPVAITEWADNTCRWQIFVATNRGWFASPGDLEAANTVLDHVEYGSCDVELSKGRRGAERSTAPDAKQRATVDSTPLSEFEFLAGVSQQVERSRQQDLLVFVHGFNVSFDSAITRTAQLALDMPFNGAIVSYCWPSQGGVRSYDEDERINQASVAPFSEFLQTLRAEVPPETRIHIVVHSMGNRIVMESLSQLPAPKRGPPISNLVLCAPDVGQSDFIDWAPGVVDQCERVTLYANASDSALIASKGLHAEMRAGDAEQPTIADGVETIDCSRIDLSFMGHSYYGSNTDMLSDLFMLVKEDLPASKRPHLKQRKSPDGPYWEFSSSAPAILCTWHFDETETR